MATNSATLAAIGTAFRGRAGAPKYSVASLNGTGSQTAFNIPHGVGGVPTNVSVLPVSEAATAKRTVTTTSTNIVVTFEQPPALGTGNLKFRWWAHRL